MAYQPLTKEQFQSARGAGFSPDKIIQMEQVRKAKENTAPASALPPAKPQSDTPFADMIPHFSYDENNGAAKTVGKALANIPHEIGASVENIANVPIAAYKTATDQNVQAHPLDAVSGALGSLWDNLVKPVVKAGMTTGRTIEGAIQTGVKKTTGLDIGTQQSQEAYNNVGKNIGDTANSARQSLVEHPIATASMVEGLIPGTGTAVGQTIKYGGYTATKPVTTSLKTSAQESISRALMPTTKANKAIAEKIAPEILNRPASDTFAFTRQGLEEKAATKKEAAGQAINDYGRLGGSTPTKEIISSLEKEKGQYSAGKDAMGNPIVVNDVAVAHLSKVQDIIKQYGDTIDNETLRDVRKIFDKEISRSKGFALPPSEGSMIDAKKFASDRIRGVLADANPDIAKLNKEYNFWSNLETVIGDTNKRVAPQTGFGKDLATMAGAASGHGAVNIAIKALTFRWLASAVKSTGWRLVSARIKNKIADAIASGEFTDANNALSISSQAIMQTKEWKEWQTLKKVQTRSALQTKQTTTPIHNAVNIPKTIPPPSQKSTKLTPRQVNDKKVKDQFGI